MARSMGPAARDVELAQLNAILQPLHLQIREIQSDGNCLFRALADQLSCTASSAEKRCLDHVSLRVLAAQHISAHKDEFEPYLEEGTNFTTYCQRIASSIPVAGADVLWGGQLEIHALSVCLGMVIEVYGAEAPVLRMGSRGASEGAPSDSNNDGILRISYNAHFFTLGAHYNSVIRIPECPP